MTQGDPRLILGPDGSRLQFTGGQPLMDGGLENQVLIALFTSPGWCGNALLDYPVGSDFEIACNQPITRSVLNTIRNAAERALASPKFGQPQVTVRNPVGRRLEVSIILEPNASLLLVKDGQQWRLS